MRFKIAFVLGIFLLCYPSVPFAASPAYYRVDCDVNYRAYNCEERRLIVVQDLKQIFEIARTGDLSAKEVELPEDARTKIEVSVQGDASLLCLKFEHELTQDYVCGRGRVILEKSPDNNPNHRVKLIGVEADCSLVN